MLRMKISRTVVVMASALVMAGCYPPQVQYTSTKLVQERRHSLEINLLNLLPPQERDLPTAKNEARWLSDTAYKAAAGISRINGSHFPGWAGNALVNTRLQDRGLCWHYQHDMYRELRRRKLSHFRIGCCVRDQTRRSEHNCVYVAAKKGRWPDVWVLDAWMWNGRLKVNAGVELDPKRWKDLPDICHTLSQFYIEGHRFPIEHWFMLRGADGSYDYCTADSVIISSQFFRMNKNIEKGRRDHPGSLTNY